MGRKLYYPKVKDGSSYHRHIAEKFYGRKIEEDEEVHHIDGDPFHWEYCNLVILKKKDHEILSKYMMKKKETHYPKFKHWEKKKK